MQLDAAAASLVESGIEATTRIQPGKPAEVIAGALAEGGFDLLVMGAYTHSPLRSMFFGSRTTEMLKMSRVPTLLLR